MRIFNEKMSTLTTWKNFCGRTWKGGLGPL